MIILHEHMLLDRTIMAYVWQTTNPHLRVKTPHLTYFKKNEKKPLSDAQLQYEIRRIDNFAWQISEATKRGADTSEVAKMFVRVYGV